MLRLHYSPGTVAVVSAIALEEVGADYDPVLVDFKAGAQTKPAYLALNPKGRVPLLETPEGLLTETGAILEYVASDLVPSGAFQRARMRETMYYLAGTMHVAHAHKLRGNRWADEPASFADMTAKVPQTMTDCCAYLEAHLEFAPFAIGADLTLADIYLFVVLSWAPGDGVDMGGFPKLSALVELLSNRASIGAVRAKGML